MISFKNNSSYVQRKINVIFRIYRVFVKVYIDNIIVFNQTLKKYIVNLHFVFQLLNSYKISFLSKKFYFDYFKIVLLNQKMNVFDLIIVANKLVVIVKLNFFYNLKKLKTYLNLIDWLQEFIVWYIQKIDSLQQRKTLLLRQSFFNKNNIRKIYFCYTVLKNSIIEKLKFYC